MSRWFFAVIACVLCLPVAPGTPAAEDKPDPIPLEEIIVISTPIIEGNQVDRFGASATVVTDEQFKDLNAQDMGTALRRTPGVNISRYNPIGSFGGAEGGGVFIRGMGSSRPGAEIKTFIDGVPMYMSVWNHPLLDLLSIDPAASIHVYKSPQPQHFGNAFAITNIDLRRIRQEGIRTNFKVAGGSYATLIEKIEHGGKAGAFDYYLAQSFRRSNGHRDNSDGRLTNYYGRMGMEVGEHWYVSFFGLRSDNFAFDPGVEGQEGVTRQGKYETSAWMGQASLNHAYENFEGSIKVFANTGKGNWFDQLPPGKDLWNEFTFSGVRIREIIRPWAGGEAIFGLDWDVIEGELNAVNAAGVRTNWEGPTNRILSPFAAVSQFIGDRQGIYAIPSAGIRYYNHNQFDSQSAPHAGLVLGHKSTQIHAGYSRGMLYPGLEVVLLSEYAMPLLGESWKSLKAEKMDHYEIGVRHTWERLRTDVTFFRDGGKNRYVIIPPPPPPPTYASIGDYRTQGVEATLSYSPKNNLSLFVGGTLLDTDPGDLPYAPNKTFSAGMNWRFMDYFRLSMDGQYVSEMNIRAQARRQGGTSDTRIDGYVLFNGKLSYQVQVGAWNKAPELFIAVENLTHRKYEYLPGYPMPGINGMVGVVFGL